jgi:hypothetical protein
MATTTTNYGFDVPTSSDLVKNGATQIALLGQDIDTFLFRPFTKNYLNNGGMDIWQRGTTFSIGTSTTTYTADRFLGYRSSAVTGMTVSRSTDAPTGFTYSAKVQRDSGITTTNNLNFRQALESQQSRYLAGKTVVVSFYAKAGANYSSASNALVATLYSGTGTDQSNVTMSSWTGVTSVAAATSNITTSWVRYSMTGTVATSANQIGLTFANTPVGTAGADDSFLITGVQIEEGNQASPFAMLGESIPGELAACQRYYFRAGGDAAYENFATAFATSTTKALCFFNLPVTQRLASALVEFSTTALFEGVGFTAVTALTYSGQSKNQIRFEATVASGLTQYRPYAFLANNSTAAYVGVSAEL